jgi:hypothetical protein
MFAPLVDTDTVTAVVRQSHGDLDDAAAPASPEAVEQLARRRLHEMTDGYAITAVANAGPAAGSSAYLSIRLLSE